MESRGDKDTVPTVRGLSKPFKLGRGYKLFFLEERTRNITKDSTTPARLTYYSAQRLKTNREQQDQKQQPQLNSSNMSDAAAKAPTRDEEDEPPVSTAPRQHHDLENL